MRNAAWSTRERFPPYLVLLRVGFTMPPPLPPERCALTAPFHPYHCVGQPFGLVHRAPRLPLRKEALQRRYVFCGTGRLRALKPASRTLSGTLPCGVRTFLPRLSSTCVKGAGSDRPVLLPHLFYRYLLVSPLVFRVVAHGFVDGLPASFGLAHEALVGGAIEVVQFALKFPVAF